MHFVVDSVHSLTVLSQCRNNEQPNRRKQMSEQLTIREWLDANFEGGASCVEGVDDWGKRLAGRVRLGSSQDTAFLQSTCGGDVIISFSLPHTYQAVIVRDDSDGEKWDRKYRSVMGAKPYRPHAKLVLKQTA